jgi:diacylglycerol kinase family enzyme
MDHGLVELARTGGSRTTRAFANVASVGFSANVARAVGRTSKRFGGTFAFYLGVVRTLLTLGSPEVSVHLDGEHWYHGPVLLVAVANGRFFGGGMQIAPEANPRDGLLDVVLITAMTRLQVLRKIHTIYKGRHIGLPWVKTARATNVEISAPTGVPVETDGEEAGLTDARFRIVPDALSVLLPPR